MNDVEDPYENDEYVLEENTQEENTKTKSNERREKINPQNLVETMISFNEIFMKDQ